MYLIDTHTHLYLKEFEEDLSIVISRAKNDGVKKFYLPAIDSSVLDDMLKLETDYPGACIAMIGLHPCSVKENYNEELEIVSKWLHKRKFVAIGEIGLDYYWDQTFIPQQIDAFKKQMELALSLGLPIVIHTRNAMQQTIDAVRPYAARGLTGIFHCFGDSVQVAQSIIQMGFLLGIGGVITYKKSGLAEVIEHISLDHIVLETDSPYLTPVPFRGKRNESSYIKIIAERLAQIKNVSIDEVAAKTTANAEKIFGK
jgi:TatD DNase family protein